ncbi:SAM-dependent methyltransferase [Limnothrix sp. PR1529]|uniref:class I SAM-dependent methyltransferase n=1 Tax=Limnothrix sp. PR1529 TaxID=1704291 RepID=UPI00081EAA67|nr:class I SAM-dependent methyltransferase [Limnothrix sp. PR1529]OCQ93819.1 SAM-dependent methyltransferase [Limnothrix sp. P13C2]PIB05441.1 SAM-dependent methyltransferase [Limnothrix sp. PR1529]
MKCRHCQAEPLLTLIDLGSAPLSNAYLTEANLNEPERWYPLRVLVCNHCWLVQTEDYTGRDDLFGKDYAYFSSVSSSWLAHANQYVKSVVTRFELSASSLVVELAANDGYLLQYVQDRGIPCYGVEPTTSTAGAARAKGIDIVEAFFGVDLAVRLAEERGQADLVVANNVLAHVPDINDFVLGVSKLLKPSGVATFEFPHLLNLIDQCQFDTIYHEHYSYLSLTAVHRIFAASGLEILDVEEIPTHGGSLRVFAQRQDFKPYATSSNVDALLQRELNQGLLTVAYYAGFQEKVNRVKDDFLTFLLKAKEEGKVVAAYGAAAKGNTLLNYAGIRPDLISFVVDRSPGKQGKLMPGSRIPIVGEDFLKQVMPDCICILPWNLKDEITAQLDYIKGWGGSFVLAIPELSVIDA